MGQEPNFWFFRKIRIKSMLCQKKKKLRLRFQTTGFIILFWNFSGVRPQGSPSDDELTSGPGRDDG